VIDLEWCSFSGPWQIVKVRGSICTLISLHWSAIGFFVCWVYQSSKEANVWSARGPLVSRTTATSSQSTNLSLPQLISTNKYI